MKVYKTTNGIVIRKSNKFYELKGGNWDEFINDDNLLQKIENLIPSLPVIKAIEGDPLAPVGNQELWACGVTYLRSKVGRQEESKSSGGADFYAKVYEAERPEVFFKSTSHRIVGHLGTVNIR